MPLSSPLLEVWLQTGAVAAALGTFGALALAFPAGILRWRRSVLLAIALLSLGAIGSVVRFEPFGFQLQLDPSTEPLLPLGDPQRAAHERARFVFGDDQVYVIALECGVVFEPACLRHVDELGSAISRLSGVQSVTSLLDVTSFGYVAEEDWVEVRPFIDEIPLDPAELARLRERALHDPVYRRTLVSEDASVTAIEVRFASMDDAELIARDLDGEIERLVAAHARPGVRSAISGRPHFKTHVYRGMLRDLGVLIPASVLTTAAVLAVFHGSLRGIFLPLGCGLGAVLWTFAAMALLGRPLSLLTVLIGPTLLAFGSVYGLHVLARYEEEVEVSPAASAADITLRTLLALRRALGIAAATTAVGFAALMLSDVPAVFELGCFAVLGVASILVLSAAGAPALLASLPLRSGPRAGARSVTLVARAGLQRVLAVLANGVAAAPTAVIVAFAAAAVVAVAVLPCIEIDTDYLSYFRPDDPVRIDFDFVNSSLSGAVPLYIGVEAPPGMLREPALLEGLATLQRDVEALDGVGRVQSFLDPLRMLNRAFAADDPTAQRIPQTRAAVSELMFMIPKVDMSRHATVNHAAANLVARTGEVGSAAVLRIASAIEVVAARTPLPFGDAGADLEVRVTGNALLLARSADGIARGQPASIGAAALGILIFVALALHSLRFGAIAMLPNLVPVLFYFGLLGLGVAPLSLPTSLIGCIALGIAIDDTAHFLVRYRDERASGIEPVAAAARCTAQVGRPIAITTMMLGTGFGVIALSSFATLQEFGLLTAATMGLCLIADLVLMPALLIRLRI
ncbi:MAG: MMPL family transporter [Myxococcota bacterium]|nr:MMPL family transporter [Myxococcota bacterium]